MPASTVTSVPPPEFANIEDFVIVVAGGGSGSIVSTFVPCAQRKLTSEIDKYKPANWRKLIDIARKELNY